MAEAQTELARAMEMPDLEIPGDMPLEEVTSAEMTGEMPGGDMAAAAAEEESPMPAGEMAGAEETGEMPTGEMPAGPMGETEERGTASVVDMSGTWRLMLTVNSIGGSPKA